MPKSLIDLLENALEITSHAAGIPAREFTRVLEVDLKPDESPVTIADRATEAAIRKALAQQFPNDGIFGEEYGISGFDQPRIWVCDPIDGTKSFITGVPLFGMLLALVENGKCLLGIVRLPALGHVYAGGDGLITTKDKLPIHTSNCKSLAEAVVFINEAEKIYHADQALFARLLKAGRMRRMGYDCLPHALVSEGRVDAVVDFDLKPYDYLPLVNVVEGAGGIITDWKGRLLDFDSDGRVLTAATPELHNEMLEFLNQ